MCKVTYVVVQRTRSDEASYVKFLCCCTHCSVAVYIARDSGPLQLHLPSVQFLCCCTHCSVAVLLARENFCCFACCCHRHVDVGDQILEKPSAGSGPSGPPNVKFLCCCTHCSVAVYIARDSGPLQLHLPSVQFLCCCTHYSVAVLLARDSGRARTTGSSMV